MSLPGDDVTEAALAEEDTDGRCTDSYPSIGIPCPRYSAQQKKAPAKAGYMRSVPLTSAMIRSTHPHRLKSVQQTPNREGEKEALPQKKECVVV